MTVKIQLEILQRTKTKWEAIEEITPITDSFRNVITERINEISKEIRDLYKKFPEAAMQF